MVLQADEFIGMLGVNVSVRFSGDMAMVMVVAPGWRLLANVIKQHMLHNYFFRDKFNLLREGTYKFHRFFTDSLTYKTPFSKSHIIGH